VHVPGGQDSRRQFKIDIGFRLAAAESPGLRPSVPFLRVITKFAFDILSDSMHLAIRQLNRLGSGAVLYTVLSKTRLTVTVLPTLSVKSFLWVPLLFRVERDTVSKVHEVTSPLGSFTSK